MQLIPRLAVVVLCLAVSVARGADPTLTEWKDPKGSTFKGEPIEVLGPLALWRTGATSSKFLPLHFLAPEDCLRFYQAIAGRPARAERWSDAKGRATSEFVGRLQRMDGGKLRPAELAGMPEPELLIVVFGSRKAEGVHWLIDNLQPFVSRVERVYPGRVATVVMSTWDGSMEPRWLPASRAWYVTDPRKQGEMKLMSRFVPGGGFVMMLMTREGVPLFAVPANNVTEIMHFVDGASDMLWQLNPANPRTARDRAHYLRPVRAVQFATGAAGPILLSELFRVEGLRQNRIGSIEAQIDVSTEGGIARVELLPESDVPERLRPAMAEAIRRSALFVPAVENGAAVASTYRYSYKVPAPDPQLAADAAWVTGEARVELPLTSWLILKPVHVPEMAFGGIDHVGSDGTVMMKAVTAGEANKVSKASQLNSFNSDWFSGTGAASVQPNAGDKQEIDGKKLTWKRVKPQDGLVDFMEGAAYGDLDYCIGYAWTEFESPADCDAWLGLGSDDGVKIWLNGELVNDQWIQRSSRLDNDVVPLRLKKGKNAILIKIQNMKGIWSFIARLRIRAEK